MFNQILTKGDINALSKELQEGYVRVQRHPNNYFLCIYNYAHKAMFNWHWNSAICQCRGLILDLTYNEFRIVSRPIPKFFNYNELKDQGIALPDDDYVIQDKLDGYAGILYFLNGKPFIATRGSFDSKQAVKANEILYRKYLHLLDKLNPNYTYQFEIIYPEDRAEDRLVLDYGDTEDLYLITVIDTMTGEEYYGDEYNPGFPTPIQYTSNHTVYESDFHELSSRGLEDIFVNKEGVVIHYRPSNLRVKVKFDEYKRIQRIRVALTEKKVFEYLVADEVEKLKEGVLEEHWGWVDELVEEFKEGYTKNWIEAFRFINETGLTRDVERKYIAKAFQRYKDPGLLFALWDKKHELVNKRIWKAVWRAFEIKEQYNGSNS